MLFEWGHAALALWLSEALLDARVAKGEPAGALSPARPDETILMF